MSERVQYSTKIDKDSRDKLAELSRVTRIPQTKLLDEALEDLFEKYKEALNK
jgi:predicted transcriptional regulator